MSRPHDMGGRKGAGAVRPAPQGAPVFETEWHARAMALTLACGALGRWNIDAMRHAREKLPDYARLSYYEKWLAALADMLVARGLVTEAELAGAAPSPATPEAAPLAPEAVGPLLARGAPVSRPGPDPRFAPGDAVRCGQPRAEGHTRLPAYAAGHTGRVLACHGTHVFPDSNAGFAGENPQPFYSVAFAARDLFPDAAEGDEVILDLFEPYLEPA